MDLEGALDELFSTPLEDFTARRNALAKRLEGAAAATVKAVRKPNLAAWAANQLAHRHASEVDEIFTVTDRLRGAQRRVLSGGKASDLRKATDDRNRIVGRLVRLAEEVLKDAGHAASASTLQGVRDSLLAVASDTEGAELLRKGRLQRELQPSPIVDVPGLALVETDEETGDRRKRHRAAASKQQEARRIVSELRGVVKDARATFKEADRAAERSLRAAEEAERKATAAHEEAGFARRAADARRADLEAAEQRLAAAQAALSDLEGS